MTDRRNDSPKHRSHLLDGAPCGADERPRYADTMGVRPIFRLGAGFADLLRAQHLSSQALRLVLGLAHLTEDYAESHPRGSDAVYHFALIAWNSMLRRTIGPQASNDASAFRRGVGELAGTDMFRVIEMPDHSQAVHWAFSEEVLDRFFDKNDRYGLVDIRDIGRHARALPIHLHLATKVIWRMRRPRVEISIEELGAITGTDGATWEQLSRPVLAALGKVCRQSDCTAVVRLIGGATPRAVGSLAIELLHAGTSWRPEQLMRSLPWPRAILIVHGGGVERWTCDQWRRSRVEALLQKYQKPAHVRAVGSRPSPAPGR